MPNSKALAIFGGVPSVKTPFKKYSSLDVSDEVEVLRVLKSGNLSQFIGDSGEFFLGGPEVQNFEKSFAELFQVNHAVSVNSWTSGLWAAMGALSIEPGSEVITSPWTMAATATTILHWNAVPVFADIEPTTFNLDVNSVESYITSRTRAIVSPDIFGQSADIESLQNVCKKHGLYLISDTAQSPLATRNGYFAGTSSDIGGFSFNYHKHIQTGEGGMLVSNNPELADRLQLLRNHGEVALAKRKTHPRMYGILGMNLRLGEIESALGTNQLKKLNHAVESRRRSADRLTAGIQNLSGLSVPYLEKGNSHVYYIYGITIDPKILGVSRENIIKALIAEGVPGLLSGYCNLHKLPLFSEQLTYKNNPLPYSLLPKKRSKELKMQKLAVAEELHNSTFIGIKWCEFEYSNYEVDELIEAFCKVWSNLELLR